LAQACIESATLDLLLGISAWRMLPHRFVILSLLAVTPAIGMRRPQRNQAVVVSEEIKESLAELRSRANIVVPPSGDAAALEEVSPGDNYLPPESAIRRRSRKRGWAGWGAAALEEAPPSDSEPSRRMRGAAALEEGPPGENYPPPEPHRRRSRRRSEPSRRRGWPEWGAVPPTHIEPRRRRGAAALEEGPPGENYPPPEPRRRRSRRRCWVPAWNGQPGFYCATALEEVPSSDSEPASRKAVLEEGKEKHG